MKVRMLRLSLLSSFFELTHDDFSVAYFSLFFVVGSWAVFFVPVLLRFDPWSKWSTIGRWYPVLIAGVVALSFVLIMLIGILFSTLENSKLMSSLPPAFRDVSALLFPVSLICVAIFFLPLVPRSGRNTKWLRASRFWAVGAVVGLIAFAALVGWWAPLWTHWVYLFYPMLVGASAGFFYSLFAPRYGALPES